MKHKIDLTHPVDNSALIHLALHNTWHSNCFRAAVHLKTPIRPAKLQKTVNSLVPRFPMLAAGIRKKGNSFIVVPQTGQLYIRWDKETLAYMPMKEIQDCALRILYGQYHIAVEFFHSLTDGAGALQFLKVLIAEYLDKPSETFSTEEAWTDSFYTYATKSPTSIPGGTSYLLPMASEPRQRIHQMTLTFSVKELRATTRAERATITAFSLHCLRRLQ